jgi:hypothetical protein
VAIPQAHACLGCLGLVDHLTAPPLELLGLLQSTSKDSSPQYDGRQLRVEEPLHLRCPVRFREIGSVTSLSSAARLSTHGDSILASQQWGHRRMLSG